MGMQPRLTPVDSPQRSGRDRRIEAGLVVALCGATIGAVGSVLWGPGSFVGQATCANWQMQENWQPPATCLAARNATYVAVLSFLLLHLGYRPNFLRASHLK